MPAKGSFVRLILAIGLSSVLVGEAVGDEQGEDSSQLGNYNLRLRANGYIIQELDERLKRVKWKLRSVNFNTRHVYEIIENSVSYLEGKIIKVFCATWFMHRSVPGLDLRVIVKFKRSICFLLMLCQNLISSLV